jgi:hypothetical protein
MNCRAGARRSQGFGVPDFSFETTSLCGEGGIDSLCEEAVSKVKIRPPFSFAGSAELQLGIFKDLKSILHFG